MKLKTLRQKLTEANPLPQQQAMANPNSPAKPLPKANPGSDQSVTRKFQLAKNMLRNVDPEIKNVSVQQAARAHERLTQLATQNPNTPTSRLFQRIPTQQAKNYLALTRELPQHQLDPNIPVSSTNRTLRAIYSANRMAMQAAQAAEKAKQSLNNSVEITDKEQISEIMTAGAEDNPPTMIMLRRRGIRIFPDGKRVALYDNKQLGLVVTIPYKGKGFNPGDIPNVTSEGFDPEPKEIAAHLIQVHGKGKVTDKHISEYEQNRDSNNPLDHEEIMDQVKKMSEETDPTEKEVKMARGIAFDKRYKSGNMTGATNAIEKIRKGLSSHPQVKAALQSANEEVELDEAKMSAAVKLQRAFEIEQMKSKASRERGQKLMSQIRADLAAKKEKQEVKEEAEQVDEAGSGWMLKADPKLGAKVKANTDKAKQMNALMKKYGGKTGEEISKMKEEVEGIEENLDVLKNIADTGKAGTVKFKDGSMSKVQPQVAGVIHQLHGALNDENKKKVERMISHSAGQFDKVADFAVSKSQWTINK